jgi:hypothetical protein
MFDVAMAELNRVAVVVAPTTAPCKSVVPASVMIFRLELETETVTMKLNLQPTTGVGRVVVNPAPAAGASKIVVPDNVEAGDAVVV